MNKEKAIENLYSVFNKYTTADMHFCQCGCIKEENVKKLASKKLRELEQDDLISYHGSAMYTWGDVNHYKHFLPRILELYSKDREKGQIDLYSITAKLDYSGWKDWPESENEAVTRFFREDWSEYVNQQECNLSEYVLEYYTCVLGSRQLIELWNFEKGAYAVKNFVNFFYSYGNQLVNRGLRINGMDFSEDFKRMIVNKDIVHALEKEFFNVEESAMEYAGKVSVVLQIIEQAGRN